MCWSSNVSLGFSLVQAVCLSVALFRGRRCDFLAGTRGFAAGITFVSIFLVVLAHLPILAQELLSGLIWGEIDADLATTDATHCSELNRQYSYLLALTVSALPLFYCAWNALSLQTYTFAHSHQKMRAASDIRQLSVVVLVAFGAVALYFSVCQSDSDCAMCTFQGPFGHLIWPLLHTPSMYLKMIGYPLYLMMVTAPIAAFRGSPSMLVVRASLMFFPTLIVPLYLLLGEEFGSLWCWSAGFTSICIAMEPFLTKQMQRRMNADI